MLIINLFFHLVIWLIMSNFWEIFFRYFDGFKNQFYGSSGLNDKNFLPKEKQKFNRQVTSSAADCINFHRNNKNLYRLSVFSKNIESIINDYQASEKFQEKSILITPWRHHKETAQISWQPNEREIPVQYIFYHFLHTHFCVLLHERLFHLRKQKEIILISPVATSCLLYIRKNILKYISNTKKIRKMPK